MLFTRRTRAEYDFIRAEINRITRLEAASWGHGPDLLEKAPKNPVPWPPNARTRSRGMGRKEFVALSTEQGCWPDEWMQMAWLYGVRCAGSASSRGSVAPLPSDQRWSRQRRR